MSEFRKLYFKTASAALFEMECIQNGGNGIELWRRGFDGAYYKCKGMFEVCGAWEDDCNLYEKVDKLEWYENIPEGGVLCHYYTEAQPDIKLSGVCRHWENHATYGFSINGRYQLNESVVPFTKYEILKLLNNAPEGNACE